MSPAHHAMQRNHIQKKWGTKQQLIMHIPDVSPRKESCIFQMFHQGRNQVYSRCFTKEGIMYIPMFHQGRNHVYSRCFTKEGIMYIPDVSPRKESCIFQMFHQGRSLYAILVVECHYASECCYASCETEMHT